MAIGAQFHLFIMFASVFGVLLFLYGFFPLKASANVSSESLGFKQNIQLQRSDPVIGRLIFMVIDALKADFITGPNGVKHMPYLASLVTKGEACIFTAKANPPTVTMPRIKAMVTGTVPGFVDIVLNLGSPKLITESFISNLVSTEEKAIFYGDDTWLRLFPDTFSRSEGTTSFFVADYTEVDVNVTRHLAGELVQRDWTLMVLHYLGLDHIGHLVGPRSPLVEPKLMEMDAVIQQIHLASPKEGLPQMLLVCGDHGMKDSGSHGGASQEETHVAVVSVGTACRSGETEISQVDLAPTLSVLLGLPEPAESIGVLIPELLLPLIADKRLEAMQRNAQHLASLLGSSISSKQESLLLEAMRLHAKQNDSSTDKFDERAMALYTNAASDMSQTLAQAHSTFDLYTMGIGAAIVLQCTFLLTISTINTLEGVAELWRYFLGILFFISLNCLFCSVSKSNSIICSFQPRDLILQVLIAAMFSYINIKFYSNIRTTSFKFPDGLCEWFLMAGTLVHSLALGASSLVEEEHQVWYFLWPTLLIFMMLQTSSRLWPLLLLNLALHRIVRKLNQTGDKWASLPDIEDYLAERKYLTTLVFQAGIVSIGLYLMKFGARNRIVKSIYAVILLLIYLYRTATGGVHFPYLDHHLSHQGWLEARLFAVCLLFVLSQGIYEGMKDGSPYILAATLQNCWLLGVALLRRPHDVVLLPVQLLASNTVSNIFCSNATSLVMAHSWLGWVFFFYQGNSNSLASVDVAAGYVGLLDYQPVLVGLLLLAHTYSAPVLAQLLMLCSLLKYKSPREVHQALRLGSVLRLLPMCVYLAVVALQREHLFIWSVFAPKLLYEGMATLVFFLILLPCYICSAFYK